MSTTRNDVNTESSLWVAPWGLSTNAGTGPDSPWPAQYAIDYVCDRLILNNALLRIKFAAGKYGQLYLRSWVGSFDARPFPSPHWSVPTLEGDVNDPDNVEIDSGGGLGAVGVCQAQPWMLHGFRFRGRPNQGLHVVADWGSAIYLGQNNYDETQYHVMAQWHSRIEFLRSFGGRIDGDASGFVKTHGGSLIVAQGENPFALRDGLKIAAFAIADGTGCVVDLSAAKFTGKSTGIQWQEFKGGQVVNGDKMPGHLEGYRQ